MLQKIKDNIIIIVLFTVICVVSLFAVDYKKETKTLSSLNVQLTEAIKVERSRMVLIQEQIKRLETENESLKQTKEMERLDITRKDGTRITKTRFKSITEKDKQKRTDTETNLNKEETEDLKVEQKQALNALQKRESEEKVEKSSNFKWLAICGSVVASVALFIFTGIIKPF